MLCSGLKKVLPDIIEPVQSAFVEQRVTFHNIFICQDMLRHYERKSKPARCTMKVDLLKAFDSLDWEFIREMLIGLKFPEKFVKCVMLCVTTPSYSLTIYGKLCAKKKTAVYFGNVKEEVQQRILQVTGFQRGSFLFRYLGVPITSKRISKAYCEVLVDKISKRLVCMSFRHLSYAGRVTLINAVLMNLHTYWAQVFLLPKSVQEAIIRICRAYLWEAKVYSSKPPPIAWKDVCYAKNTGGLGIRECISWNVAAIGKYVWQITNKADLLWIKWIHSLYIKEATWWEYRAPVNAS
ncbi:uncharacterized protein LOC130591764 [Beta vulgaris subsp. vulgaris]|uniref:uncharacterized protein LOC130591764 n=1 Tax=Beta vulgaris subsp. vulgaris TaxID=3555 RepID=UPI002549282D|nr:uncharacterized protein LOC130591764 [Beta vulgaris subsp. vulgaris]